MEKLAAISDNFSGVLEVMVVSLCCVFTCFYFLRYSVKNFLLYVSS